MKIGFFDSGIGGLTVFSGALKRLPHHEYLYYADTEHAPYGKRPKEEVLMYVLEAVDFLVQQGAQMIVIACNTATSIAITTLPEKYDIPIIGMEPAVKPAIECVSDGSKRVLVTATPLTLKEEKMHELIQRIDGKHQTDLLPLPDLVRFAEALDFSDRTVLPYLEKCLSPLAVNQYGAVVLGCTHFPLFRAQFEKLFESTVHIVDGSSGTVSRLEQLMREEKAIESSDPKVKFYQSGKEVQSEKDLVKFTRILAQLDGSK